jgi:hypothetical protein
MEDTVMFDGLSLGYKTVSQMQYMKEHFGIEFNVENGFIFIDPISYEKFAPQLGDVGLDGAERVCRYMMNGWIVYGQPRHENGPVHPVRILWRRGSEFITPVLMRKENEVSKM